jgi:diguanylate cyclase (GGDEF)-like protein/PAS domain S-box-containing protein
VNRLRTFGNIGSALVPHSASPPLAGDPARLQRAALILNNSILAFGQFAAEEALLEGVCRIIVDGGYPMAVVALLEQGEGQRLKPTAWAGFPPQLAEALRVSWSRDELRDCLTIAVHTGKPSVVRDYHDVGVHESVRERATRGGYRSEIALPLTIEGRTVGALGLYASEAGAFDTQEAPILEELALELAAAMTALRTRSSLNFFASMDRINLAIHRNEDFEQMLGDVLDVVMSIFACDRTFLLHPCDLSATEWRIPMERTRPAYPGAAVLGIGIPMDPEVLGVYQCALAYDGPVIFGPGSERPLPKIMAGFQVQSMMVMAIYPKGDKPYMFGLHQCRAPRVWTPDDAKLFKEIGRRLGDGLSGLLAHRSLRENEALLRTVIQTIPDLVWLKDPDGIYLACNRQVERLFGAAEAHIVGKTDYDFLDRGMADVVREHDRRAVLAGKPTINEEWVNFVDGGYRRMFETVKTPMRDHSGKLIGVVGIARDITARKVAEREIEQLAYYDPLTQLPNRRLLMHRLQEAVTNISASRRRGALLFIDLDNFKILNDTIGHDVGDRLLCSVAKRLTSSVREGDLIARFGGDEFVVMLENLSRCSEEAAAQAGSVGEKILAALNRPYTIGTRVLHSTPSIGVAFFGDSGNSVDDLIKQADIAMYQAKAAGRNALRFFNPDMQTVLAARVKLETELRQGIQRRQFALHYQPQVDAVRGIIGAEALLRWEHPERGTILPAEFIPLAEETGLILPIGQWVLETACAQLKSWAGNAQSRDLRLAINVSARQFRQPGFIEQVDQALRNAGAPAERLEIELTETVLLDDIDDTNKKMHALKRLGVGFCLDDFGTGYSSLSYLTRLPLDQIKIDRSFVCNLPDSSNDAIVVQTIITMARSLGLTAIAEGVETVAQKEFLERNGCPTWQGFLLGRPVRAAVFAELLVAAEARREDVLSDA